MTQTTKNVMNYINDVHSDRQVIADFHVHLNEIPTEKDFFEILDLAEANGVQCLTLLEFSNMNFFKYGLWDRVKDKIKDHYSGKLLTAVECVSTIDDGITRNGYDFSGQRADIVISGFDPADLMPFYDDEHLSKLWNEDLVQFVQQLKKHGFEAPMDIFKNDCHASSFARQYLEYLNKNPEEKKRFMDYFAEQLPKGADRVSPKLEIESDITRYLMNPGGPMFYHQKLYTNLSDVLRMAKQVGADVSLAHPAHMNTQFDTEDYLRSVVEFSHTSPDFQPVTSTTRNYMLDSREDTAVIDRVSADLGLKQYGASDGKYQYRTPEDKPTMYCYYGNQKILYTPRPGFAIVPWIDSYLELHPNTLGTPEFMAALSTAPANLTISQSEIDRYRDVRDYHFDMKRYIDGKGSME